MSGVVTASAYRIEVPEGDLEDLRRRLRATRWPDDVGNADWSYGVERGWLQSMVGYWLDDYDWRRHEAEMNAYRQLRVDLDGTPVHALHVTGTGPAPVPLVLTHGWPWTFWDMRALIGPLTDPAAHGGDARDAFDVVIPSLPGFGFSTPLPRTGIDVRTIGKLWVTLMRDVLGYDRFGAYGGDWGAIVTAELGHTHAQHLIGVELSLPVIPGVDRRQLSPDAYAEDEQWMLLRNAEAEPLIRSHLAVHRTDPQTLSYALADSPVGTAAWIWERRRAWSDCGGDVTSVFSRDDLITTAAIYWLTGSIATSLRLHYEHLNRGWPLAHRRLPTIEAPTGFAVFPKELALLPRSVAAERTNLHRWTVLPRGGHFAPVEQPAALVEEIRAFFRPLR